MGQMGKREDFIKKIEDKYGNEYTLVSDYINNKTDVILLHNKCGKEFPKRPYNFIYRGQACPHCNSYTVKGKDKKWLQDKLDKKFPSTYTVIDDYSKLSEAINIRNNICGHVNLVRPDNILYKDKPTCNKCSIRSKKTHDEFVKEVEDLVGDEYSVLGVYTKSNIEVEMLHNKCGHSWLIKPNNFTSNGNRCPICTQKEQESKGIKRIEQWLKDHNINYEKEFTIPECSYKKELPFDFGIFNDKDELELLIEFDGAFHYKPWDKTEKSIKKFEEQKVRDKVKNSFCLENEIKLLRISYLSSKDIEKILEKNI